jgi:hypothetical protein
MEQNHATKTIDATTHRLTPKLSGVEFRDVELRREVLGSEEKPAG